MINKAWWFGLVVATGVQVAGGAEAVLETFQRGLFEEEANRNPVAAIEAYQSVLSQLEEQRKLAATTMFRLGECYRKVGQTNDAVASYQLLLRQYPNQTTLVTLARQNLIGLGAKEPTPTAELPLDVEVEEIARLEAMIRNSPDLVNAEVKQQTPLGDAAAKGLLRVATFLLDHGARVDFGGEVGPPLILAAQNGHKAMVELLLARGADLNRRRFDSTALHYASTLGFTAVAEVLLNHGADINTTAPSPKWNYSSMTPLHSAVEEGREAMVRFLIKQGADLELQSTSREQSAQFPGTPLHRAVARRAQGLVEILLASGSDPNAVNEKGMTPLQVAAAVANVPGLAALIQAKADVNMAVSEGDRTGWTALHFAALSSPPEAVKMLIEQGADVDAVALDYGGCGHHTPLLLLMTSRAHGDLERAEALVAAKADVEFTNSCGMNPLLYAISQANTNLVELLLEHHASPNVRDAEGRPALHLAGSSVGIVELLLAHRADPNAVNSLGETLLHELVTLVASSRTTNAPRTPRNFQDRLRSLQKSATLERGSDQDLLRIARLLIEHGANVNCRDQNGYTPLSLFGIPPKSEAEVGMALISLLRRHGATEGALEPLPDPDSIRVWRSNWRQGTVVHQRGSKDWNRYTLLETLMWNQSVPEFPDVSRITIHRSVDGTKTNIAVNLINPILGRIDCTQDVWLEFGDVVEVPEKEHALGQHWQTERREFFPQLTECLQLRVTLMFKNKELFKEFYYPAFLGALLRSQGVPQLLTTAADLSRIVVRRVHPVTGEQEEILVDAVKATPPDDLWLRDGDVVLVPEKEE